MQMMKCQKRIRQLKLVVIFSVAAFGVCAQVHRTVAAQEQPGRLFELVGITVPLEQRVGVDDGAAFVVHFSGDTRGSLDTCG
jgi:hypothetical protein